MSDKSNRNKTITCDEDEIDLLSNELISLDGIIEIEKLLGRIANADFNEVARFIPRNLADLIVLDPPYNLTKDYNGNIFSKKDNTTYVRWFSNIVTELIRIAKYTATVYVCSDWQTSNLIYPVLNDNFMVRNRITWEREKGRGASRNWKNNTEDIWFCTVSNDYYFDVESVKLKKVVLAPYRDEHKEAKDWYEDCGNKYRLTYPSNIWTDITIPFWSMPENTEHPTQKPEKLIAKLVLASSKEGDLVFDPFLGSGTSAVVANKLNRRFFGIEINKEYCCVALKRLHKSYFDAGVQGYEGKVFLERNSCSLQKKRKSRAGGFHLRK